MQLTFSDKELYIHFKQFMDMEPSMQGQEERDRVLELWEKGQVDGFVAELERLSQDQALWRVKTIDLVYWHKVLNALDTLLHSYLDRIKGKFEAINISERQNLEPDLQKVIKFLKSLVQYASATIYFNLTPYMIDLYYIYSGNPSIREEILTILICITSKIADKKWMAFNKRIEDLQNEVKKIMPSVMILIKSFFMVSQFLLNEEVQPSLQKEKAIQLGDRIIDFINFQFNKKPTQTDTRVRIEMEYGQFKEKIKTCDNVRLFFEEQFILILKSINLYLNTGNLSEGKQKPGLQQTRKLEKMLPPAETVDKFILFVKDPRTQKKLQTQVINTFFLFIILDLNQIFDYVDPTQNKFYLQACKNPEFFIQLLTSLAKHHSYDKIQLYLLNPVFKDNQKEIDDQLSTARSLLMTNQENEDGIMVVDEDNSLFNQCEGIKSQKFMNAYLNFLCQLINIKNKQFQTQLHSQFLKPILAILSVKPINRIYPVNINVQVKAAKLLKDVIRHANLDESNSVEKVIDRIKVEINNIYDSETKVCLNRCKGMGYHDWEKAPDDDTDNNMLFMYKQEFIRACMRFLCYSVFRNDPNQINFNQNFIANSRKILESGIVQNEIMNLVIKPSFPINEAYIQKIIDPIFLSCVQLVSYVFNDLPQKIPQYLENGLLPSIIEALEVKIPIGPEVFSLIMKFLYTICLNPEGAKLVYNSKVINTLMMLACESSSYSHLSQNLHKQITYQQQLQQLALISQDISNKIYKALIDNFTILNKRAWEVTEYYVEVDNQVAILDQSPVPAEAKIKKVQLRQKYEKKQTQLELCYENVTNMLFNFIYAENEQFGDDNMIHRVLKQHPEYFDILLEVIATPIVASACPNMFRHFIYFFSTVINEFDQTFKLNYYTKIMDFLQIQLKNLHLLLGTDNLDSLQDINSLMESNKNVNLGELCNDQGQKELLLSLRGEDQISVCFGKISFYCDVFRSSLGNYEKSLKMIQFEEYIPALNELFKIQALINRYHSQIYYKELNKQEERYRELCLKYPNEVASLTKTQKKGEKLPGKISTELEELEKLHYQFVTNTVTSLSVVEARLSHRTVIELGLEDNISHTSNLCQIAIRKLLLQNMKVLNKQKIHFTQAIDEKVLLINQAIGKDIAEGFKESLDLSQDPEIRTNANYIMKLCCQHSAILGEFNKVLFPAQITSGYLLVSFIDNKGLDHIAYLVKWVIETVRQIELKCQGKQNIRVDLCKHIQLLWSHVIDFYSQLLEGKYLDSQFQQCLIAFKSNPTEKIKKDDPKKEYETALQTMQKYMYSQFVSVCHFLFFELDQEQGIKQLGFNVFQYFDKYSELFFSTFMDIYQYMCNGFLQCKLFDINANKFVANNESAKEQQIQSSLMRLVNEIVNPSLNSVKSQEDSQASQLDGSPSKQSGSKLTPAVLTGTIYTQDDLIKIIEHTLATILQFKPTNPKLVQKIKIIESLIFKLGIQKENQKVQDFLLFFKTTMFTLLDQAFAKGESHDIGTLAHTFECLLRFKRGTLFSGDDIYKHLNLVNGGFRLLIADLSKQISMPTDKIDDLAQARMDLTELITQVNTCLSLFLNIAEEIKTISDIKKLDSILTAGSSLAEPIQGISEDLKEVQDLNTQNIFITEAAKAGHLLSKMTLSLIELFQSLHHINIDFEPDKDYLIYTSIYHSICLLNFLVNIKDQGDFDCHQLLLKNNGLGALFEIKCIQKDFEFQRTPLERKLQSKIDNINVQSKILLQQLCSNDQSQIRIYESLIKSILFINFQERYKREEGQDVKKILINEEMKQQIKQQQSSKKKKLQTPMKRSKSEERHQELADSNSKHNQEPSNRESNAFVKQQSKVIKQILYKIEYGDTQLSEFLSFFNNVMQIQDLKSFLQACQNVCLIKKKKVIIEEQKEKEKEMEMEMAQKKKKPLTGVSKFLENEAICDDSSEEDDSEEEAKLRKNNKDSENKFVSDFQKLSGKILKNEDDKAASRVEEKLFICLNTSSLKEMLNNILQLEVSDLNETKKEQANVNNKHSMQRFQQEIVFNLLEKIIDQIRDQQMMILQICKNPQNPTQQGIKLDLKSEHKLSVTFPQPMKANKYLFDCICLISHLTYIITHTPNLVSALLKHKEGKTFKFLIRNIYFLLALKAIQQDRVNNNEVTINLLFNDELLDKKCKETIVEFFKRVLLDNPHQTVFDRKLKAEARQIFIKESLKNLCDTNSNKYPQWPILRVVFNVGAVWIISGILNEEENQGNQDKKVEALVQSTLKFRNILRSNMTKQLIFEAQQLTKQEPSYHTSFNLLKQLERIQTELQDNSEFFSTIKESIEHCMNCVLCFLKPFENNQALWGEKSVLKPGDISESGLGFMFPREGEDQSIIDENEEEDDEGDEESHSSSDDEEDDDELLQSERLGEDFGFGDRDEDIDYGSELEDEDANGSSDSQGEGSSDGDEDDDGHGEAHRGRRSESDPIINDEIEIIGDSEEDFDSYGDEEEDEYIDQMISEDIAASRAGGPHKDDVPMEDENENEGEPEDGEGDSHLEDQEDDEDEELLNEEEKDQEEEDEEEDDDSEDLGENYSEEYYDESESALGGGDEQANNQAMEIQIMMGMDRQGLDAESVNNAANGGGGRQRRGADMGSLNNISMDMFNMNMGAYEEESKDGEHSDSDGDGQSQRQTHMLQTAAANGESEQINQISGIVGNIITMMRQAPQYFSQSNLDLRIVESLEAISKKRTNQGDLHDQVNLQDLVHTPGVLLKDIFNVNKKMQQSEDLFKLYIKEQPTPTQAPASLSPQVVPPSQSDKPSHQKEPNHEIETSTKSQFSTKNPFENNSLQQRRGTTLFPSQQNEVVQIETSSQHIRQDMNNLDGLDPEFLENLGMEGLQNIIDTDNVINNIVGQGSTPSITNIAQLVENCTNREQRNSLFMSMDESLLNTLPPQLYSEALIVRRVQGQPRILDTIRAQVGGSDVRQINGQQVFTIYRRGSQNQSSGRNRSGSNQYGDGRPGEMGRNRFMSFDSQINGLGDFTRNFNDPFFRNNRGTQPNAPNSTNIFRQNTLFSNVVQFMKDELTEMTNQPFIDPQRSLDLDKFCVQLLQQAFSSEPDSNAHSSLLDPSQIPLNYSKIQGLVEMATLWYKCGFQQESTSDPRFDRLMKIMIRIQGVRYGVMVEIAKWMTSTMRNFHSYVQQDLEDKEHKFDIKSSKKVYMSKFLFNKQEFLLFISFVLLYIRSIKHMESFINQTNLQGSLDILKPPSSNASLNCIFHAITQTASDNGELVMQDNDVSIFQYIIDELISFANVLDQHPEYVIDNQLLTIKDEQSRNKFYEDLYSLLASMIKFICNGIANKSKLDSDKQEGTPLFDETMLNKLGDLLIFQRDNIPKKAMKYVKSIFSQLTQADQGQRQLVLEYFRSHLSQYLSQFIGMLRPEAHSQKLSEIQKVAGQIIQLLKISKEESKNGGDEANICDQEFYFQLMDSVSQLIEEKSAGLGLGLGRSSSMGVMSSTQLVPINTQSVASGTSVNSNNLAFIFKEEFRTIMMVLFVLIEYNLKFIFTHQSNNTEQQKPSKKKQTEKIGVANHSKKNEKKKEVEEVKERVIEFQTVEEMQMEILQGNSKSKSGRVDLMDAIEQHLKAHISDEKIREDKRLKYLIKFCLEHKKVINSFIRANQQVLNESLRNVVIQVPQMLDFDNKRLLFRSEIKKMKRKYRLHYIQLNVRRDQVFADSFEQMRHLSLDKWRGKMSVEFSEEQGIDEGGLTKEWFILLSKGIFNPDLGLFTQSSTGAGSSYYPNTNSGAIHGIDHIDYFTFIGKIVGKALIEQQLLDAYFVRALYKIILGQKLTYHDVEDFDNELYKNLKWCLDNSTNGIGLTFTETHQYFDVNTDIELIPGGKDIEVTDENKFEYVQKKAYYKLYQQIQKQADAFLKGFYGIVPKELIQIFDSKELELLISGLPTIDIEDLRENTEYQNYTSQSLIVKWLWEVLEEFDNSERAEFIQFVTGSSKVPVEGFKGLRGARGIQKFQIVKVFSNDTNRLPQAHTCFKQLELPNYTSKEMLKERLLMAITEGKTFGFA